jgi:serine/threonine protein kinase
MDAVHQLAQAVEDVHAAGVTHNDIKADNCLRSMDGEFKLADLGLGVRLKDANKAADGNTYSLTTFEGYGVNIGLQGRPPEVLLNAPLTPKVDVWSFGCLMYTIMTGLQSPYKQEKKVESRNKSSQAQLDLNASTALDVGFENQRIVKGKFSLQALETAKLPAHTTVAAREILHRMLDPDPKERPTASEVCDHPVLWDVEECMDAIREVYDRRMVSSLSEQEESALPHAVWNGRPGQAERAAQSIRNWKSIVIPSLLVRAEKYVQRASSMQQTWEEARAARASAAAAAKAKNRRKNSRLGSSTGENMVSSNSSQFASSAPEPKNFSYGNRLQDLIRFARNMHEHPPLEAERAEMLRALGTNVATLLRPEDTAADPWTSSRKIVEAYFAHTFPDLPLFAHHLLTREVGASSSNDDSYNALNSTGSIHSGTNSSN